MNSIVALPIVGAIATPAPAMPCGITRSDGSLQSLGSQYDRAWATFFRTDDLLDQPSDELGYAIGNAVAKMPAEWVTKVKPVVLNFARYWECPFADLDWDEQMLRMLVESIFASEGAQTVEQYLESLGHPIKVESKYVLQPHADAELIELSKQYEELLAAEEPLKQKMELLSDQADRLRYERMGVDPDDADACRNASLERWQEWMDVYAATSDEIGRGTAYNRWNRSSEKTGRLGKKILKIKPVTAAGLLVKARVIETHDEICGSEAPQQLMAEIRAFAKAA
ncbi:hypothetical protein AB8A28_24910 [Tardiphaga sp. 71_E8_N1_1]|uniref:hypothetical protein n=1 Tax=Tardiphaga sp. 71_E8_N1_1 TaxID=3240784 RepID=UPI003F8C1D97